MASVRDKIIEFLKSLKFKNQNMLDYDIYFYGSLPDTLLCMNFVSFESCQELANSFSVRYSYCFSEQEFEKLSRFYNYYKVVQANIRSKVYENA